MSAGTLDDWYLEWLYDQVLVRTQVVNGAAYWKLLRQMYQTEFRWFVPNDGNRAEDGKDLRTEWAQENGILPGPEADWFELPCSFLEMLIALARRMAFEADRTPHYWFWHLLQNLEFDSYHDGSGYSRNFVVKRMRVIMDRVYDAHGNGGLFPLRNAAEDQRRVELWYQMSAYLLQDM